MVNVMWCQLLVIMTGSHFLFTAGASDTIVSFSLVALEHASLVVLDVTLGLNLATETGNFLHSFFSTQ